MRGFLRPSQYKGGVASEIRMMPEGHRATRMPNHTTVTGRPTHIIFQNLFSLLKL